MLADRFDANKARELGFVNWVVPPDELDQKALHIANKLAKFPTEPMQMTKRLIHQAFELQGTPVPRIQLAWGSRKHTFGCGRYPKLFGADPMSF